MIIVYPHLPELREKDIETKVFMDELKGFDIYEIITPKDKPFAYHEGLKLVWGKDDIIIIESDVVPTIAQLNDLISCPCLDCSLDNRIMDDRPDHRGQTKTGFQRRIGNNKFEYCIEKQDRFADLGGLACTKISKLTQIQTNSWFQKENFYWKYLDYNFWDRASKQGRKIHIHWDQPKHNHEYDYFKENVEDRYNLKDYYLHSVWGQILFFQELSKKGSDELVTTCSHVLKLPTCCRDCTKMLTDQLAQEQKK